MKLHLNSRSGNVCTSNLSSSDMPKFLRVTDTRSFDLETEAKVTPRKRYLPPLVHLETINILNPTEHYGTLRTIAHSKTSSMGHQSRNVKGLMTTDVLTPSKLVKKVYINRYIPAYVESRGIVVRSMSQKTPLWQT